MAGDAATKAASKVQPTEEQMSQIDSPAEDNTWHEVPDMSKEKFTTQMNKYKPFGKKDVKEAAGDASQAANPDGTRDPTATAETAAQDQQTGTASGVDGAAGADAATNTLKAKVDENNPEAKNKTKEYKTRGQTYLKGKMPKERREQTIWRLKKMVIEIQGHQDCRMTVELN